MFQGQLNAMHAFLWMVTRHALLNLNLTSHRLTILFCRVIPRTLMPREVYIYIYICTLLRRTIYVGLLTLACWYLMFTCLSIDFYR